MASNRTEWRTADDNQLYSVEQLDETPLAPLASRTRYALIATGQLASVAIGTRRFVTKRAVLEFIRTRETAAASP